MILDAHTAPHARVYHAEECRMVKDCTEVDTDDLTYTVVGPRYTCRSCGLPFHDTIKAKKITVNVEMTLIVINPIEDNDNGNEEEKSIAPGILRPELVGVT